MPIYIDPLFVARARILERWGTEEANPESMPYRPNEDWADYCEFLGLKLAEIMLKYYKNPDEEDTQITRWLAELRTHVLEGRYK